MSLLLAAMELGEIPLELLASPPFLPRPQVMFSPHALVFLRLLLILLQPQFVPSFVELVEVMWPPGALFPKLQQQFVLLCNLPFFPIMDYIL